ncbi:MAG: hypothetical protein QOC85_141, partial [Streptomyces sp.]|nr:hypothetical protein [Streptomyces sp.]
VQGGSEYAWGCVAARVRPPWTGA